MDTVSVAKSIYFGTSAISASAIGAYLEYEKPCFDLIEYQSYLPGMKKSVHLFASRSTGQ